MQLKRTECFHRHIGGLTLLFVVILFAVVSSGANDHGHSSSAETTSSVHTGHASEFDKSLKMPRPLAVMIDEFIANTEKNKSAEKEAAGSTSILDKVALERRHMVVSVTMSEETPGVLSHKVIQIPLRQDGAIIDFRNWVTKKKGYFRLKIDLPHELQEGQAFDNLRVFYVSRALPQELRGKVFGSGCSKFMEITSFYKNHLGSKEGLKLNTTDQRYLSVVAGNFYFFTTVDEDYFLGSVSFVDSRYKAKMCKQD